MKLYKLTDANGQTRNNTQWSEGVTHTATGDASQDLCSDGWIHAYTDPLLAVLLNPAQGYFKTPQLWEAEGEVSKTKYGLKVGCRSLTTIRRIPLPKISTTQKVAFGILAAKKVNSYKRWNTWADNWLSGKDRTAKAALAARQVLPGPAEPATKWAAQAAQWAAWVAKGNLDLIAIAHEAMKYRDR